MDPNTKEEFDAFKDILTSRLSKLEDKAQFPAFVEGLIRDLIVPLQLDDVRKISSTVTAMVNEKQKAQKDTGKKKKSAKASIKTVSRGGGVDTTDYGDVYDEFADFI